MTLLLVSHKSSIITLADIKSKMTIALVTENHKSISIAQSIINFILKLPQGMLKNIIFDCGKKFSKWKLIEKSGDYFFYCFFKFTQDLGLNLYITLQV